ncbi:MAG: radical SAM protein [Desulfobacterota bacterium]|nr:radical SAM protein [Thermodesulfobacteriota bacterium]
MNTTPFILLIQPWIYDFAAFDLWIRPLGLLTLASVLQQIGCGVHLIDCLDAGHPAMRLITDIRQPVRKQDGRGHFHRCEIKKPACLSTVPRKYCRYGITPEVFLDELKAIPRPHAILVSSMMTYWYPAVVDCIRLTKEIFPNVPLVLGGVYATLCPDHAQAHTRADYVLPGPLTPELFAALARIIGIDPKADGLDFFPEPAYSLMRDTTTIPLMTSQGCPLRCPYCASSLLHPHFIQKQPDKVFATLLRWYQRGATDFVFYDDALLVYAETHIIPLLQRVIDHRLDVRFHAPNGMHIRLINDRIAGLMREAGFRTIRLSLETVDPEVEHYIGAKSGKREFEKAVSLLLRAGFDHQDIGVYILAGLPFQKADSVAHTIEFVQSCGVRPIIAEYSPIPGTALWDDACACASLPIAQEPLFHNNTLLPCQWQGFTLDDLVRLKQRARMPFANAQTNASRQNFFGNVD